MKRLLTLFIPLLVFASVFVTQVPKSSATSTSLNYCTISNINSWNWPSQIKALSGISYFDATQSSYYVVGSNDTPVSGARYRTFVIYIAGDNTSASQLQLTQPGGAFTDEHLIPTAGANVVYLNDPIVQGDSSHPPSVSYDTYLGSPAYWVDLNSADGTNTCYAAVHNITYGSDFTDEHYADFFPFSTTNPVSGCDGLDVACYIRNAVSGISDTLKSLVGNLFNGVVYLFIPSSSQLSASWSGFYTPISAHLGFLLWPFTFMASFFTAMVTPSTTCCTIVSGFTIFGTTFHGFDLTKVQTSMPTVWAAFTVLIRGFVVFGLVFSLRNKFMHITGR
jgi:hypothetical protein